MDQIKRDVDIFATLNLQGYREAIGDPLSLSCLFGILASIFISSFKQLLALAFWALSKKSFSFLGSHMFSIFKSKVNAAYHGSYPKFGGHMDFLL